MKSTGSKKILGTGDSAGRTDLLNGEKSDPGLPFKRKCDLLGVSRSTAYSKQKSVATKRHEEDVELVKEIEAAYAKSPFYGSRRITAEMARNGRHVSRKRVQSLMQKMGLRGIAPGPMTSKPHPQHKKFPYLLKDVEASRPNQIWSTDITYIPTRFGFMYLTANVDWFSRRILSYRLSNTMSVSFCVEALDEALRNYGKPEIFNSDQGAQFTSEPFVNLLQANGIAISMDGKARAFDNIFTERFWRTIKYEWLYLHFFNSISELKSSLMEYMEFYNSKRLHQSLNYRTPNEVYTQAA